jgi:hypothetical protein
VFILVAPPRIARGTYALAILAGSLTGIATRLATDLRRPHNNTFWLQIASTFGPEIIGLLLIAALARRRWIAFWTSLAFTTAHVLSNTVVEAMCDRSGVSGAMLLTSWSSLFILAMAGAFGAVVGLIALAAYWLKSRLLLTIVAQDGSLCWKCGYDPGSRDIAVCPECGIKRGDGRRFARLFAVTDAIKKRSRFAVGVSMLIAAAVVSVWATQPRIRRVASFYSRFRDPLGGYIETEKGTLNCAGSWLGFSSGTGPGLWISYQPDFDTQSRPAMKIRLSQKSNSGMGDAIAPLQPTVDCELDRAQAEWVIRHGLPDSLLRAFRDALPEGTPTGPARRIPAAPHVPSGQ